MGRIRNFRHWEAGQWHLICVLKAVQYDEVVGLIQREFTEGISMSGLKG